MQAGLLLEVVFPIGRPIQRINPTLYHEPKNLATVCTQYRAIEKGQEEPQLGSVQGRLLSGGGDIGKSFVRGETCSGNKLQKPNAFKERFSFWGFS